MELILTEPEDIIKVSKALSVMSRVNILKLVAEKPMSVTELSEFLHMTKGNISSQLAELEDAGLIEIKYENGMKGIKKIVKSKYTTIVISLSTGDTKEV
ncbi:ArsR family transcriptional regulator [Sulfolobus acidocaldarius SUSAZ]|nr:ArsR family transcriptional regulator [Sulfolobus acidocaldarius SUSAZ]